MTISRKVSKVATGYETEDGGGVKLRRVIGGPIKSSETEPFLMLDEFKSDNSEDYIEGFPDHPHRGFQTITYMIKGIMEHKDHAGNHGILVPGSVQWMTAGRGIIHSEMPKITDGSMSGFQFWLNLPASQKMMPPQYQDIPPEGIPEVNNETTKVRVMAGKYQDTVGPVVGLVTNPIFLDVTLQPNTEFSVDIPDWTHNSFVFVFEGEGTFGPSESAAKVSTSQIGLLENKDTTKLPSDSTDIPTTLHAKSGEQGVRFLFLSAKPLKEPIVQHGPFVMNTQEEIRQAISDYQNGKF